MTPNVHLIFRSINGQKPEMLPGDFKRFTNKMKSNIGEATRCNRAATGGFELPPKQELLTLVGTSKSTF